MSLDPLLTHLYHQRPVDEPQIPKTVQPDPKINGPSFSEYMKDQITKVNNQQQEAARSIEALATGQTDNVGEVMTTIKKSEVAFNMLLEVRNKLQEAYTEISRMQI